MRMVGGSDCDANIANGIEICAKSRQYKKCFCMKLKSFFLHNLGAAIGYNTIKHPVTNGLRQTKSIFFRMAEKTYVSTSRTLRNGSTHVLLDYVPEFGVAYLTYCTMCSTPTPQHPTAPMYTNKLKFFASINRVNSINFCPESLLLSLSLFFSLSLWSFRQCCFGLSVYFMPCHSMITNMSMPGFESIVFMFVTKNRS